MAKNVAITERMRKEIRRSIAELTPNYKWYLIAKDTRESVELAYISVHKENSTAEIFSDDGVTSTIYSVSRGNQLSAERTIKWLEENNLWIGAKLNVEALPEKEEQEEDD